VRTAAIVALLATGCSFIGVRGAPPPCTDNYVLPIIDGVVVSGAFVGIGVSYAGRDKDSDLNKLADAGAAMGVVLALPLAVSALYGLTKVSTCRAAPRQGEPNLAARERLRDLHVSAVVVARSGDCDSVDKTSRQILRVDSEFHRTVFVADPAIRQCLAILSRREDLLLFLMESGAAAQRGDCKTVQAIAAQVLALDAAFHKNTFLADVGIRRCLEPAITAPPIAPAPAPQSPPPTAPVQP